MSPGARPAPQRSDGVRTGTGTGTGGSDGHLPLEERTIDFRRLARVGRGEQVKVQRVRDYTLDAFDRTLSFMAADAGVDGRLEVGAFDVNVLPADSELRRVFKFAEILGGYDAFNDITRLHSPTQRLAHLFGQAVLVRELTRGELAQLEEMHAELKTAVDNAKSRYRETNLEGFTVEEMQELYAMVVKARDMAREINEIIGKHLLVQIERSVQRLSRIRQKILQVERTVSGIFLVDDEVMFIPETELAECIDMIFKGVGNPYLANNVDGVLLLAARNLLIEVVSFYSYYGKHQIYQLFKHGQAADRKRVMLRIRNEVREVLRACKESNKLVLTRLMEQEEQQLDLSIEAIQQEAEQEALDAVIRIFPEPPPVVERPRRGWLRRMLGWMVGAPS